MSTRTWIAVLTIGAALYAGHENNLAAVYIAIGVGGITFLLHAIEVKLNKLLDVQGVTVWDSEIAKDR